MKVLRKPLYWESLQAIEDDIAKDNLRAALDLWLHSDDPLSQLADSNFPRRRGRVEGTLALVVHPNDTVILVQHLDTVTAIEVLHSTKRYP